MTVDYAHMLEINLTNDEQVYHVARQVCAEAYVNADDHRMLEAADALAEWVLDSLHAELGKLPASWRLMLIRDLLPSAGDVEWRQVVESLFGDDELQALVDGE